ncbi:MAG: hypothetical protein ACFFHD_11245 [Promethearchaeota archaeon]
MVNEEPGPCFVFLGIVMIVFDFIIINSTFLMYFGGFFIFLGIIFAIIENKKTQKKITTNIVQSQTEQQLVQIKHQNLIKFEQSPESHEFCPYCGKNTISEICPECGQKID